MNQTTTPRMGRGWAILGLLASGGIAFFAVTRPWWQATITTAGMPTTDVAVVGSSVVPWIVGVSLVVMAAALGVLAGSAMVRRLMGALVVLVSIAALVGIFLVSPTQAQTTALDVSAVSGAGADWQVSLWRSVAVVAFFSATLCGVWALLSGHTWATMSSKYDAPSATSRDEERDAWKLMDDGIDPTE